MTEEQAKKLLTEKGWGLVPPQQYLIDMEKDFLDNWERVKDFTLISVERGYALYQAIGYTLSLGITQDFVECGVWKGGASMLAALEYLRRGCTPDLWLYDTYQGMTEPDHRDIIAASGEAVSNRKPKGWWAVSLQEVKENLLSTGYPSEKIHFIEGDVLETLKRNTPQQIGILRLDTDWYQSTKMEMEVLYPALVENGVLLIDDYGHFKGARQAVDEFFQATGKNPLLQRVDYTGRLGIKR